MSLSSSLLSCAVDSGSKGQPLYMDCILDSLKFRVSYEVEKKECSVGTGSVLVLRELTSAGSMRDL